MTQIEQEARTQRAQAEVGRYTFRRMTMKTSAGPRPIVYVTSASGGEYAITEGRHHRLCNCPDYQKRCSGTLAKCKHLVALSLFEQSEADAACRARLEQRAAEVERAVEKARRMRQQMAQDFPEFDF